MFALDSLAQQTDSVVRSTGEELLVAHIAAVGRRIGLASEPRLPAHE
jgi:hypothetical protein